MNKPISYSDFVPISTLELYKCEKHSWKSVWYSCQICSGEISLEEWLNNDNPLLKNIIMNTDGEVES